MSNSTPPAELVREIAELRRRLHATEQALVHARAGVLPVDEATERRPSIVWLLEDSAMQAKIAHQALAPEHEISVFREGASLLERTAVGSLPDVLVLDWQLPGLSGLEVLRFLRQTHDPTVLPVLMLTMRGAKADLADGLAAGANDYLAKPYDAIELRARVGALLRICRLAERARRAEKRFAVVQATAPDGFVLLRAIRDAAGTIADFECQYVNPAAERILRRGATELLGTRLSGSFPGHRESGPIERYQRVLTDGVTEQYEFHDTHEGFDNWYAASAAPVGDEVAVTFRDITPAKRAEAEREELLRLERAARLQAEALAAELQAQRSNQGNDR